MIPEQLFKFHDFLAGRQAASFQKFEKRTEERDKKSEDKTLFGGRIEKNKQLWIKVWNQTICAVVQSLIWTFL